MQPLAGIVIAFLYLLFSEVDSPHSTAVTLMLLARALFVRLSLSFSSLWLSRWFCPDQVDMRKRFKGKQTVTGEMNK
eukprot:COSAG02_NODE_2498_length_8675_cov_6.885378_8_plen_77_part_00